MNDDNRVAITRYLYKFINHRSEIKKLKWHEKDWLFLHMRLLKDAQTNKPLFDIFKIEEAKDFAFYWLLLMYTTNTHRIDFSQKAYDYDGVISKKRQAFYSSLFWKYMNEWSVLLNEGKGAYLSVLKPLYCKKT